jgi:hypothetical protein
MKNRIAAGENVITNEMAMSDGLAVVEWLACLLNLCMNIVNAPEDWRSAIVVPLLKGMGYKKECKNYMYKFT